MSTRREFLRDCATVVAAAMTPHANLYSATSLTMKDVPLDELSFTMFAGQLHTTFRVQAAPARVVEVELVEADLAPELSEAARRQMPQPAGYERFSLMFAGARHEPLPQQIHRFEHPELGRFEVFIVPVLSPDAGRTYYQAVFNRPVKGAPEVA